jgi:ATP-dependent helicase/nuclease subunit B
MSRSRQQRIARVQQWLANGGVVLTATERAARALTADFSQAQRAAGKRAWPTPEIATWDRWVRDQWASRNTEGLLLLNNVQERLLWIRVITENAIQSEFPNPERLAATAQRGARLLADFAPDELRQSSRLGWSGDSARFSEWLALFDSRCHKDGLISASRLTFDLTQKLRHSQTDLSNEGSSTQPLLLVGFDRLLESQIRLLAAWDSWELETQEAVSETTAFSSAEDNAAELYACVDWAVTTANKDPDARLIIAVAGLSDRRGELERVLLNGQDELKSGFEFSLGSPIGRTAVVRSALLLLRWMHEPITEPELDWLLTSGQLASSADEEIALAGAMLEFRRRGQERPSWELGEFLSSIARFNQPRIANTRNVPSAADPQSAQRLHSGWTQRLSDAQQHLSSQGKRLSPLEWETVTAELLSKAGWPGFGPQTSVVFQARDRWTRLLEECGSTGYDGSLMDWREFLSIISSVVADTIFATESIDAALLITEPAESAGLLADGIWFLGASEESWPGRGMPHPLLPNSLQRTKNMPHSSPQADWDLASRTTDRILASANEVIFSYARQSGESESRASRLVTQRLGQALPIRVPSPPDPPTMPQTEVFEDWSAIPFKGPLLQGGSATLTNQSLCAFRAFAFTRLGTEDWQAAEAGLNARQRGQLLHAVLNSIWGGATSGGISTLEELRMLVDKDAFVRKHAKNAIKKTFEPGRRDAIPARYPERFLQLEEERLTTLVTEWLSYESQRLPFTVVGTEVRKEVIIAGLTIRVRLDRVDQLPSGSEIILDYKTGDAGPSQWTGERPDNVQLPLYAAEDVSDNVEGLLFARVRPGEATMCGRLRDAGNTLRSDLLPANKLLKDPLTDQQLDTWRQVIERLGREYLRGLAEVNPKDAVETCKRCYLHAVCRIYENPPTYIDSVRNEEDSESESESVDG